MHEQADEATGAAEDPAASGPGLLARMGPIALIVAMLAVSAVLLPPFLTGPQESATSPTAPLVVVLLGFMVFEAVVLHAPLGRHPDHSEEVNLNEVMLVFALFVATPRDLVIATIGATVLVNLVRRDQAPLKQVFNGVNSATYGAVALTVFAALTPADPLSTQGWLAATAAGIAGASVSAGSVTLVVRCVSGPIPAREFAWSVFSATPLAMLSAAVAYVGVVGLHAVGSATAPLLLAAGSLLLLIRTTTVLGERHLHLAELHKFSHAVAASEDVKTLMSLTLTTATDLVHAREVAAYVTLERGAVPTRYRFGPDGAVEETPVERSEVPQARGNLIGRSSLVSSTVLGDGGELVLVVTGRRSGMGLFHGQDARVLDLVAQRAGADLHTLLLIERLRFEALHDPLTRLLNVHALTDAARDHDLAQHPLAAVWLGLRGMQEVNAALGHALGDELLVQVGRRLAQACGPDELVGRTAGDEFAILFLRPGASTPSDRAELILSELSAPFLVDEIPVLVRGRAGVAALPAGAQLSGEDVLRRADVAMRRAADSGHTVAHYTPTMETSTPALLTLASELQAGIAEDQLVLHAQPQQRLSDGVFSGVEVLVRWDHPRLGLLAPDRFLPLAASTGLERPLTAWVVEAAVAALADWRSQGLDLGVSINVPPAMVTDGSILGIVERVLHTYDQPADRVTIEVVESGLIDSLERAAEVLIEVAGNGTHVSIDDFGTGFSSLSHLRRLPLDEIKIDSSFVTSMLDDDDDAAIVSALIGMGHSLGLNVVAEGIETPEVLDRLGELGCDFAQGYHLSRPMPLRDLPTWLTEHDHPTARALAP